MRIRFCDYGPWGGDYLSYAPVNMVHDLSPLRYPYQ